MNDEDKEVFEKWFHQLTDSHLDRVIKLNRGASQKAWQAACEYKQKEIDELKDRLHHEVEMIDGAARDHIEKLQAENAKLREALKNCPILGEVHRDSNDRFKEWNLEYKYILKELNKGESK